MFFQLLRKRHAARLAPISKQCKSSKPSACHCSHTFVSHIHWRRDGMLDVNYDTHQHGIKVLHFNGGTLSHPVPLSFQLSFLRSTCLGKTSISHTSLLHHDPIPVSYEFFIECQTVFPTLRAMHSIVWLTTFFTTPSTISVVSVTSLSTLSRTTDCLRPLKGESTAA